MCHEHAQDLNKRVTWCTESWGLSELTWLTGGFTSNVAFCDWQGRKAVLKLSLYPGMTECESSVIRHLGPDIGPEVFEVSVSHGALLLEQIDAVNDLCSVYPDTDRETEIWLELYRRLMLQDGVPPGFATLEDYAQVFQRVAPTTRDARASDVLKLAFEHRTGLMGLPEERRLLHGDMHHSNILQERTGRWRLIDPHGVIGHPLYEVGAFLRNPMPNFYRESGWQDRLERRILNLSRALEVDSALIAYFGFYGSAISIAWDIQEGQTHIDPSLISHAEWLWKRATY